MSDEQKSNIVSKIKAAINSDAVKNTANAMKNKTSFGKIRNDISNGNWKSYLTKKNIIIAVSVLICFGAIGNLFEEEQKAEKEEVAINESTNTTNVQKTNIKEKSAKTNKSEQLRGPKIFGIQLGMTREQVADVLLEHDYDVFVEKNGKAVHISQSTLESDSIWRIKKKNTNSSTYPIKIKFENNLISIIDFDSSLFNAKEINIGFIKEFLKQYKLHFSQDDIEEESKLVYYDEYTNTPITSNEIICTDRKQGYKITFFISGHVLTLESIIKSSDMKFK